MYHWWAIKILLPKKSFKVALNRNFCFLSKQAVTTPAGGHFIPHSQAANLKHSQWPLLEHQNSWRFLFDKSFSSTKAVLSSKGQNRDQEKRQVLILGVSLVTVLLLIIYANLIMEYHQDYVVIYPDEEK